MKIFIPGNAGFAVISIPVLHTSVQLSPYTVEVYSVRLTSGKVSRLTKSEICTADTGQRKDSGRTPDKPMYGGSGYALPKKVTVLSIGKKGTYKVKFFAEFGQADCVSNNVMLYEEYAIRNKTDVNKALFIVPKKIGLNFTEAQLQASSFLKS